MYAQSVAESSLVGVARRASHAADWGAAQDRSTAENSNSERGAGLRGTMARCTTLAA
jgi:hypothetical protein